ncbi:MAG: hypothetical protein OEM01_02335 [Desulfobulbaceae bacterium]|nr:hypothetical protein [Desulfobulbaceae bacterium]
MAKVRKIIETGGAFQLREQMGSYIVDFDSKKDDIGSKNTYFPDININFQEVSGPDPKTGQDRQDPDSHDRMSKNVSRPITPSTST